MEKTTFERAIEEGYYISSNAPASGDFYRAEDVDAEMTRLREIELLYNEALKQEPVGIAKLDPTLPLSTVARFAAVDIPPGATLYAAPVPRTEDCSGAAVPHQITEEVVTIAVDRHSRALLAGLTSTKAMRRALDAAWAAAAPKQEGA